VVVGNEGLVGVALFTGGELGVRREGVNSAAAKLQSLGAIRYTRGQITVVNRSTLEDECCECYAAVKEENDRLVLQARVERQLCAGQY